MEPHPNRENCANRQRRKESMKMAVFTFRGTGEKHGHKESWCEPLHLLFLCGDLVYCNCIYIVVEMTISSLSADFHFFSMKEILENITILNCRWNFYKFYTTYMQLKRSSYEHSRIACHFSLFNGSMKLRFVNVRNALCFTWPLTCSYSHFPIFLHDLHFWYESCKVACWKLRTFVTFQPSCN